MLRLYTDLGIEAVDIGSYIDPRSPHDPKRPPLAEAPFVPEIKAAVDALGTDDNLGMAQEHIPDVALEWLGDDGAIVFHHFLERLIADWPRIRDWMNGAPGRRVIWRTVGQSVENNELMMAPLRADGLERVAYSPKEQNIPQYSGHDAIIRFWKDPDEWGGWTGEDARVINFTQHLYQRNPYTNWTFWDRATDGLAAEAMGPGSEVIGGSGEQSASDMLGSLRRSRAYCYTGTQPASYTLGLIEAMMTGIPVISIGPAWMSVFEYGPQLFEGHEIAAAWSDDPTEVRRMLSGLLVDPEAAATLGAMQRERAISLFGKAAIMEQWRAFLEP